MCSVGKNLFLPECSLLFEEGEEGGAGILVFSMSAMLH